MAKELEIKLSLESDGLTKASNWLHAQPEAEVGSRCSLVNRYYDTPRAELNGQRAALRIRQAGGRYIQTLKTQGEFVNGAHRRDEWEWPLSEPVLDLDLLADTPLGKGVNLNELEPVFETNFTRQTIVLSDGEAVIECALDEGVVRAGARQVPLREVEFELESGNGDRLLVWAERLAQHCPVFLNLISKAQQGYYLAGLAGGPATNDRSEGPGGDLDQLLQRLSKAWLEHRPVSFEGLDLGSLRAQAEQRGLGSSFAVSIQRLVEGESLQTLLRRPELGQYQLGMLAGRLSPLSGS